MNDPADHVSHLHLTGTLFNTIEECDDKNKLMYAIVIPVIGRLCPELATSSEYLIHREVARQPDALEPILAKLDDHTRAHLGLFVPNSTDFDATTHLAKLIIDSFEHKLDLLMDTDDAPRATFILEGEAFAKLLCFAALEHAILGHDEEAMRYVASVIAYFSTLHYYVAMYDVEKGMPAETKSDVTALWVSKFIQSVLQQRGGVIATFNKIHGIVPEPPAAQAPAPTAVSAQLPEAANDDVFEGGGDNAIHHDSHSENDE